VEPEAALERGSAAGVASSKARHTVGGEATGPSSSAWCRNVGDIGDRLTTSGEHHRHVHPQLAAVICRVKPRRANAVEKPPVSPDAVCE
jgi:hypothetical protein